jgi:hypothetical protein
MTAPTPNDHLVQARANRAHAEWLLTMNPTDQTTRQWARTAAFYSALHAMTAYLLAQGVSVNSHVRREQAITHPANGVPHHIVRAYRRLEFRSRDARYNLRSFSLQAVRDLLDNELAAVAAFIGL